MLFQKTHKQFGSDGRRKYRRAYGGVAVQRPYTRGFQPGVLGHGRDLTPALRRQLPENGVKHTGNLR